MIRHEWVRGRRERTARSGRGARPNVAATASPRWPRATAGSHPAQEPRALVHLHGGHRVGQGAGVAGRDGGVGRHERIDGPAPSTPPLECRRRRTRGRRAWAGSAAGRIAAPLEQDPVGGRSRPTRGRSRRPAREGPRGARSAARAVSSPRQRPGKRGGRFSAKACQSLGGVVGGEAVVGVALPLEAQAPGQSPLAAQSPWMTSLALATASGLFAATWRANVSPLLQQLGGHDRGWPGPTRLLRRPPGIPPRRSARTPGPARSCGAAG